MLALATAALSQTPTLQEHPEDYPRADILYGARVYGQQCERCHGSDGSGVSGVALASGKFRSAVTDQELRMVIQSGFPTAGMPAFRLDPPEMAGIVAWLRNMNSIDRGSLQPGDVARGKVLFEGKGGCLNCHRVAGKGSRKGPDLSDIGVARSAGYFERILLDPDAQLLPINRPVHVVTKAGHAIDGRRLNEDTYTVQLVDQEGQLISFSKSTLREYKISTKSGMSSYRGELNPQELADVVAFLLSLKGL